MLFGVLMLMVLGGLVLVGRFALGWRRGTMPSHPRCVVCGYDLTDAPSLVCPECGHEHANQHDMVRPRPRPAGVGCGLVMVAIGILAIAALSQSRAWYMMLPRPVLRLALRSFAPVLPPPAPGAVLPPIPAVPASMVTDWDYLVWGYQVGQVMQAWSSAVITTEPGIPDARLDPLLDAADAVAAVYDKTGFVPYAVGWPVDDVKDDILRAAKAAASHRTTSSSDPTLVPFDTGQWALAELQYDGDYSHRADWATVPTDLLLHMLKSDQARRRVWAVARLNRKQPEAERLLPVVEIIIRNDPDPKVKSRAEETLAWLRMDHDGRWGKPAEGKP